MLKYEIGRSEEGYTIIDKNDYTQKMVDFILGCDYDTLPEGAADKAKQAIIDSVGVIFAGVAEPMRVPNTAYIDALPSEPQATAIGIGRKTSMTNAAFVNGTFNHCIDFDDCCFPSIAHSTTTYLGTMLAIGEYLHLTGKDLINAYVIGHEIYNKLGCVINPNCWYAGYHATGLLGTVAAAVVGGRLMGLDAQQLKWALGIAASSAAGLKVNLGSMTKPYHAGHACEIGVKAAILAKNGFTARDNAFEGRMGFADVYGGKTPHLEFIDGLGTEWETVVRPPFMKPHPSCGGTHAAMNAIRILKQKHGITADMVERIEMGTNPGSFEQLIYPDPQDVYEGRFSATFTMAIAMVKDRWGISVHTEEVLREPAIQDMIKRVHLYIDDDVSSRVPLGFVDLLSKIRLILKDGRVVEMDGKYPIMTWDEVCEKYTDCASLILPKDKIKASLAMMRDLENLADTAELMKLLA